MSYYRSEGDPRVKDGVVLPDRGYPASDIPTELYTLQPTPREVTPGGAVMTVGEAPTVMTTGENAVSAPQPSGAMPGVGDEAIGI